MEIDGHTIKVDEKKPLYMTRPSARGGRFDGGRFGGRFEGGRGMARGYEGGRGRGPMVGGPGGRPPPAGGRGETPPTYTHKHARTPSVVCVLSCHLAPVWSKSPL